MLINCDSATHALTVEMFVLEKTVLAIYEKMLISN